MFSTPKGKPLSLYKSIEKSLSTFFWAYPQNTNSLKIVEKFIIPRELLAL